MDRFFFFHALGEVTTDMALLCTIVLVHGLCLGAEMPEVEPEVKVLLFGDLAPFVEQESLES
ncbi:MAG: hypothetical protein L0Z53_01235 [Acidobacteriales bacterium]|nr:hypothetical protein [Terriglobales bacterium]